MKLLYPWSLTLVTAVSMAQDPRWVEERTDQNLPRGAEATRAAAIGDVDGDGDLDIITGRTSGQATELFINSGTSVFERAPAGAIPVHTENVDDAMLTDLDGDGDLDAILLNTHSRITYWSNDGRGTFSDASANLPDPGMMTLLTGVVAADVDGDGDPDLLATMRSGGGKLFLNDGSGSFRDASAQWHASPMISAFGVAAADIDGDQDLDIITANRGKNRVYVNDGSGNLSDETDARAPSAFDQSNRVAVADVDGDGDMDAFFANGGPAPGSAEECWLNDGTGHFSLLTSPAMPFVRGNSLSLTRTDFNRDGVVDFVVANLDQTSHLYLSQRIPGGGIVFTHRVLHTFDTNQLNIVQVAGNLDGRPGDEVFTGGDGQDSIIFLDGSGDAIRVSNQSRVLHPLGIDVRCTATGDFDNDGIPDTYLATGSNQPDYLMEDQPDGTVTFTPVSGPRNSTAVTAIDVDGDGDLDIIRAGDDGVTKEVNDGAGTFGSSPIDAGIKDGTSVSVGDITNDGSPNVVVSRSGGPTRVLSESPTGWYADSQWQPPSWLASDWAGICDVDGDGDLDLLEGRNGANGYFCNTGDGWQDCSSQLPPGTGATRQIVCFDADNDGDTDLYECNGDLSYPNGPASADRLLCNNAGTFTDCSDGLPDGSDEMTIGARAADLNDDGFDDLLLLMGFVRPKLLVNDTNREFTDESWRMDSPFGDYSCAIVADGDGDGDQDVRLFPGDIGGGGGDRIVQLSNLRFQARSRAVPVLGLTAHYEFENRSQTPIATVPIFSLNLRPPTPTPFGRFWLADPIIFGPLIDVPSLGVRSWRFGIPSWPDLIGRTPIVQPLFMDTDGIHLANPVRKTIRF